MERRACSAKILLRLVAATLVGLGTSIPSWGQTPALPRKSLRATKAAASPVPVDTASPPKAPAEDGVPATLPAPETVTPTTSDQPQPAAPSVAQQPAAAP